MTEGTLFLRFSSKKIKLHLLDQFHLDLERFMFPIFHSIKILHNIKNDIKHHPIYTNKKPLQPLWNIIFIFVHFYSTHRTPWFSFQTIYVITRHSWTIFSLLLTLSKINNQIFSLNSTQHYTKILLKIKKFCTTI